MSNTGNRIIITKQGERGEQGPIGPIGPKGDPGTSKKSWTFGGSNNSPAATTGYLFREDGSSTVIAPLLIRVSSTITDIVATTNGSASWSAEVHVDTGGGFSAADSIVISGADNGEKATTISLNPGDKVALHAVGSGLNTPSMNILILED